MYVDCCVNRSLAWNCVYGSDICDEWFKDLGEDRAGNTSFFTNHGFVKFLLTLSFYWHNMTAIDLKHYLVGCFLNFKIVRLIDAMIFGQKSESD